MECGDLPLHVNVLDPYFRSSELDDLETDLFQTSLKKVPERNSGDEKTDAPKKLTPKIISKEPPDDDEFDDDDVADLLIDDDDDDAFGRPKATKAASDVAAESKIGKKPPLPTSHSFDSLDNDSIAKGSPRHTYGEERGAGQASRANAVLDSFMDMSDFEKGLFASDSQKHSTFQDDAVSPKKVQFPEKDLNFPTNKAGDSKSETTTRIAQSQKKKDEVNFDDSELLDDLGFDNLVAKPSKVKSNPGPSEKKGSSFMDDLFGGSKKEPNIPSRKQQEFALDEKYKSSEKKEDADAFGFGSYVPSSVTGSAPTSRRKSVKFEDESLLPRSGPAAGRRKSIPKHDSFLDDPSLSPVNRGPKASIAAVRGSANEDLSYQSPKTRSGMLNAENPQSDNMLKKAGDPPASATAPSRGRDRGKDWLGFLKDDKEDSPKHKSLDFLEKSSPKGKDDALGQRRKSSGADWLGLGKTQTSEKRENTAPSVAKTNVSIPPQQPNISNLVNPRSSEPRQVQKQMQNIPSVRESDAAPLSQLVSSIKAPPPAGASKSEVLPVTGHQPSAMADGHLDAATSDILPVMEPVVSPQAVLQQHVNMNVPSIHQYTAVETQNNFIALQSMISSLQLEKEQLSRAIEALKLKHEDEVKALESSQKNQMKTTEESFKNQEKRLKEECEAKIHNLESQVKDLANEKADAIASHKEKYDELKKDHHQETQRLKDLHSQAVSAMKEDHENALSRLKQLKDQEVEAISSTQVYARSLQHLTDQLEARASELAALQLKVDERHQRSLQERQNILDAKDKELKELKKRLDRQLEDGEEERSRLQQLVLRLESRLQQITKEGEEEKWNLQQTQAKLEIQKKMLDEERNQAFQMIEREKEKLKLSQESLLQEQKTVLIQLAQERQQLSSEKMEMDLLSKRLREEETRLQSTRLKEEANIEAQRRSFLREKENLEMERARVRQESHQLQLDREDVERDRRQLQDEKEKLSDQKYSLHRRTQEIEDMSQNAKRMKEEAKMALSSANKMEYDHSAQLEQISQQLAALRSKETQILMEKSSLAEERKYLEMKKDSLLCANCKLSLSRPFTAFTSDVAMQQIPSPLTLPNFRAVTGIQNSANVDPSLLWWYITAQKDKEYLTNEQLFLQSLHETSRKKQEFVESHA